MNADFEQSYLKPDKQLEPIMDLKMVIFMQTKHVPFYIRPTRLSFYETNEVKKIIEDLL